MNDQNEKLGIKIENQKKKLQKIIDSFRKS